MFHFQNKIGIQYFESKMNESSKYFETNLDFFSFFSGSSGSPKYYYWPTLFFWTNPLIFFPETPYRKFQDYVYVKDSTRKLGTKLNHYLRHENKVDEIKELAYCVGNWHD